jgi:hypothetical protein
MRKSAVKYMRMAAAGKLGPASMERLGLPTKPLGRTKHQQLATQELEQFPYLRRDPAVGASIRAKAYPDVRAFPQPNGLKSGLPKQRPNQPFTWQDMVNFYQPEARKLTIAQPPDGLLQEIRKVRAENGEGRRLLRETWGGVGGHAYSPGTNTLFLPNIAGFRGNKRDRNLASARHEVGHKDTLQNPRLGDLYDRLFYKRLPDMPQRPGNKNDMTFLDEMIMAESAGHSRATNKANINRSAQLARDLPIQRLQKVKPEKFQQWSQALTSMPENLRNRLLSTRAHLSLNYQT